MKNNRLVIIALAITVILACVITAFFMNTDNEGPVITVDASVVKPYSSEQGTDTLVQYAQAIDKVDGDVSDTLMVENIYVMTDMSSAKVVYTARDNKNNITKFNYMIDYVPSEEELASATSDEIETETEDETDAEEDGDGTTTKSTATTEATTSTTSTTSANSATTQAQTEAGSPVLTLSATEATISTGTTFYISRYISSITDDEDAMSDLAKRIIVKGDYDIKTAGDYSLDIYCTDSEKNESNHVTFVLHVN